MSNSSKTKRTTFATLKHEGREPIVSVPSPRTHRSRRWVWWLLVIIAAAAIIWRNFIETPLGPGEGEMILGRKEVSEDKPVPKPKQEESKPKQEEPRPAQKAVQPTLAQPAPTPKLEQKQAERQIAPSFDIVRMEKGEILVSGRAAPGALVHILDGATEIGTAPANSKGEWVYLPKGRLPPGEKKLTLYALDSQGKKIQGEQPAVLVVSEKPKESLALAVGGNKPSKILQAPKGRDIGPLRVSKLDYTFNGNFRVQGLAEASSTVRLYIDDNMVLETTANSSGAFIGSATYSMDERLTQLRADMIKNGKVVRRVEYKFTPHFFDDDNRSLIIRRGDNLWNIAVREYGRGTDYVVLFEANADQIANPNKIYARQVISVPKQDTKRFMDLKRDGVNRVRRTGAYKRQVHDVQ